jgi:hypothetical protein
MLSYSYLDMDFLSNILRMVFTSMAVLTLPGFIIFTYILIANLIKDTKVSELLERGFTVRS